MDVNTSERSNADALRVLARWCLCQVYPRLAEDEFSSSYFPSLSIEDWRHATEADPCCCLFRFLLGTARRGFRIVLLGTEPQQVIPS